MASDNRKFYTMQPNSQYNKILNYLRSLPQAQGNYENVPRSLEQELDPFAPQVQVHHINYLNWQASCNGQSRHHHHSRSQSGYGAAMLQPTPNNYYNLPHAETGFPSRAAAAAAAAMCQTPPSGAGNRSRQQSPPLMTTRQPPPSLAAIQQQKRCQLDSMTVMRLGAELGVTIDAAPEMPPSRQYSISEPYNGQMYKISFPQTRIMATQYSDPQENVFIGKGESVTVLGPSKEDRSKFTICYKEGHIDLPHQYTQRLAVGICYNQWS